MNVEYETWQATRGATWHDTYRAVTTVTTWNAVESVVFGHMERTEGETCGEAVMRILGVV